MVEVQLHDVGETAGHNQTILDFTQVAARHVKLANVREIVVTDLVHQKFCGYGNVGEVGQSQSQNWIN